MTLRRSISLRARLLTGIATVAVVLVAVAALITVATRNQLIDQVDQRLRTVPIETRGGPGDDRRESHAGIDPERGAPPEHPERTSDVFEGYFDADGSLVARFLPNVGDGYDAPDISVTDVSSGRSRVLTTESVGGEHRYRVLIDATRETTQVVAIPLDDVASTVRQLILVEIFGSLLILAALALVSWWVIRLGIRPVKEMTSRAQQIADGDLDVRVPEGAGGTEADELAVALNQMLHTITESLEEREASERRLRQFVADASHELRTPLTTIRGYAELYRHGGLGSGDALDDAMRRTEQESARMGRLVEDMLLLAKLDERRELASGSVDIGAIVIDAANDARIAEPERPIEVHIDGQLLTVGDDDRLRQVVANLVANALVHTPPDAAIELFGTRRGDDIVVEVTDNGPGMSPESVAHATERFYRADTARSRARGGSGLGLSIVQAIVDAHGGTVEIDSTPGAGTTVRLTLHG